MTAVWLWTSRLTILSAHPGRNEYEDPGGDTSESSVASKRGTPRTPAVMLAATVTTHRNVPATETQRRQLECTPGFNLRITETDVVNL